MPCIHPAGADCCGGDDRTAEWKPTFPVTGLVCYDLTGTEGLGLM